VVALEIKNYISVDIVPIHTVCKDNYKKTNNFLLLQNVLYNRLVLYVHCSNLLFLLAFLKLSQIVVTARLNRSFTTTVRPLSSFMVT